VKVLGIETATDVCSVGLVSGSRVEERSIRESRIHSEQLLVLVDQVLGAMSLMWSDVEGVALSSGPGSFTGLRIGASAAKGLAEARRTPFVPVPTFDGIRAAYRASKGSSGRLLICLDAKQDEWYVQESDDAGDALPVTILGTKELMRRMVGCTVLTDAPERLGDHSAMIGIHAWCSGATIARLGRERLLTGERTDIASFEPSYWKEFVVRTVPKPVVPSAATKET